MLWLAPGDYGIDPNTGHWLARAPVPGIGASGDLVDHDVVEHEDGSISVSPSILITTHDNDCLVRWHGWLTRGVWREVA